jgi:hypothetical protein
MTRLASMADKPASSRPQEAKRPKFPESLSLSGLPGVVNQTPRPDSPAILAGVEPARMAGLSAIIPP